MSKSNGEVTAQLAGLLDLGVSLGQNLTFGLVAGRCSAAQAESLRQLREGRAYQLCTPQWREFCPNYLHVSSAHADRIIRLWEEFGAEYFELSQLTRVSPETYRAIAPAVKEGAIHFNGEAVALNAENSRKVAAAVAEMRKTLPPRSKPKRQKEMHERIDQLEKKCGAIVAEFSEIIHRESCTENWLRVTSVLSKVLKDLIHIQQVHG